MKTKTEKELEREDKKILKILDDIELIKNNWICDSCLKKIKLIIRRKLNLKEEDLK